MPYGPLDDHRIPALVNRMLVSERVAWAFLRADRYEITIGSLAVCGSPGCTGNSRPCFKHGYIGRLMCDEGWESQYGERGNGAVTVPEELVIVTKQLPAWFG